MSMMRRLRNSHVYAYLQGLYERLRWVDGFGRTHETDEGWNEAYDSGANLADRIMGVKP